MGLTVYCSTCGRPSSLIMHKLTGQYYLYKPCLCSPYITDPHFFPREVKLLIESERQLLIEQIKERVGLAAEETCRRMREEELKR